MPYTDVFSFLKPKETVTDEQWAMLLEARKSLMMEHVRDIGQMKLGNIPVWDSHPAVSDLRSDVKAGETSGNNHGLNTRGVFTWDGDTSSQVKGNCIIANVYGFTQSGEWLLAHAEAFLSKPSKGSITFVSAPPVRWARYDVQLKEVFIQLSRAIGEHVGRRKKLMEEAQELYCQTEFENRALGLYSRG